ncbi:hypothetical protein [Rhizobium terrae]|uniref:hypothetical protein n=1 Tax=Rhizobium terrae TaxID=2171756 RepID=UPI000E3D62DE|nr:hypothetical protein [Rhizobium terrae]
MATSYDSRARNAANLSDTEVLAEAHERVEAFLELLRRGHIGSDMLDTDELPSGKASLEVAFRLVIATEPRKQARRRLAAAGMVLAQFQPGIGARTSITPAPHAKTGNAEKPFDREFRPVDAALARMASDIDRLQKFFVEAEAMAERRFEQFDIGAPFREDGTYTWYGHH